MKKLMMAGTALLAGVCFAGVNYTVQTACHPDDVKSYDTSKLRSRFVMEKVMIPDGPLGRSLRHRGRVRFSLLAGVRLCSRHCSAGRRRVACEVVKSHKERKVL